MLCHCVDVCFITLGRALFRVLTASSGIVVCCSVACKSLYKA